MRPSRRLAVVAAVTLLLVSSAALWWWLRSDDLPQVHGFVYSVPKKIRPFNLSDHTGAPFTNASLRGRWSLVFFGYTNCPDVCPATLTTLHQASALLRQQGQDKDMQYIFVSVDPQRDTARLGEFLRFYDKKFTGVTGEDTSLLLLTGEVGAPYEIQNKNARQQYLVAHSSNIYLLDPQANLFAVFNSPHAAHTLVAEIVALSKHWQLNNKI